MQANTLRRRLERPGIGAMVVSMLVTAGCALPPMDRETAQYERIDAQIRASERFQSYERACRTAGGIVILDGDWGRIQPKARDLKMARCGATVRDAIP